MNAKAEAFKKFLDEKNPQACQVEEVPNDDQNTVLFRSGLLVDGQRLPLIFIISENAFPIIRVFIAPKAVHDDNHEALHRTIDEYNATYLPFKFYCDSADALVMDTCLPTFGNEEASFETFADEMQAMTDAVARFMTENYRKLMRVIWGTSEDEEQDKKDAE